jgi:hypothetical protein
MRMKRNVAVIKDTNLKTFAVNQNNLPGARVIKPIMDVNYRICNVTTVEKFPFKISVIYVKNKLNS